MRPDIREQSLPSRTKIGVLAIGEGSIYSHSFSYWRRRSGSNSHRGLIERGERFDEGS